MLPLPLSPLLLLPLHPFSVTSVSECPRRAVGGVPRVPAAVLERQCHDADARSNLWKSSKMVRRVWVAFALVVGGLLGEDVKVIVVVVVMVVVGVVSAAVVGLIPLVVLALLVLVLVPVLVLALVLVLTLLTVVGGSDDDDDDDGADSTAEAWCTRMLLPSSATKLAIAAPPLSLANEPSPPNM